jgi:hypothetical protein
MQKLTLHAINAFFFETKINERTKEMLDAVTM